ncbi:hypothetical protein PoB_000350000 [Plakobranchus ocellatus]|uniref:Uncharacterized protein n=1 Tax=Plakobranchus ocellatus TaxID=259542 RepID=A0AAV3Y291_9GAST|nr:hypothetical protein PoB_000350000 [Plakobranchus ocellatus]
MRDIDDKPISLAAFVPNLFFCYCFSDIIPDLNSYVHEKRTFAFLLLIRRSDRSTQRKEDYLDFLYEKFCVNSKSYILAVKTALRSNANEHAAEIFERAIDVLSQDFRDPTSIEGQTEEEAGEDGNELNSLKDRIAQVEKQLKEAQNTSWTLDLELESVRKEVQNNCSFVKTQFDSTMKKNVRRLDSKIESLKRDLETLSTERKASSKEAAATSAAAISGPLKDVRQRTNVTTKATADQFIPQILDVKLLPGGRLVLADWTNQCITLFKVQGQHLHTLDCRSGPFCLAVLHSQSASNCHTMAVTLPNSRSIDFIEVADQDMKVEKSLQTFRQYGAVASVNKQTLAAGCYWPKPGINLIDQEGRVLRQICSSIHPLYMDVSEDGNLTCSTSDGAIARVEVDSGTVVFHTSVSHVRVPWGVAITANGSLLVADRSNKTLHLVSSQGAWTRQLRTAPSDTDLDDALWADELQSLSMDGSLCICVVRNGCVYMLDSHVDVGDIVATESALRCAGTFSCGSATSALV